MVRSTHGILLVCALLAGLSLSVPAGAARIIPGGSTDVGCSQPYTVGCSPYDGYELPPANLEELTVPSGTVYRYSPRPESASASYYITEGFHAGLSEALDDIAAAWTTRTQRLILRHVNDWAGVAVYAGGAYSHTIPGAYYAVLTRDVMGRTKTVSFTFSAVEKTSDGRYTALGRHDFIDSNNERKTVDVLYTLSRVNGRWVIVGARSQTR